tara:strand:- start:3247 stop:3471 length:225 start_codon:yes stop_codon:yes gene_type:complete
MISALKTGDLVWIPDKTYGFDELSYRYHIEGPTIGLAIGDSNIPRPENSIQVVVGSQTLSFYKGDIYYYGDSDD